MILETYETQSITLDNFILVRQEAMEELRMKLNFEMRQQFKNI